MAPNTYKASIVKRTQFDNTGWGVVPVKYGGFSIERF